MAVPSSRRLLALHALRLRGLAEARDEGRRVRYALDRVVASDHDWVTEPMFPSYNSCWFELHEDLLATLGRERHREGSP